MPHIGFGCSGLGLGLECFGLGLGLALGINFRLVLDVLAFVLAVQFVALLTSPRGGGV